jgi:hypothetical protein
MDIVAAFGAGIRTCIVKSGFPRGTFTVDAGGIVMIGTLTATAMITAIGITDIAAAKTNPEFVSLGAFDTSPGLYRGSFVFTRGYQAVWAALRRRKTEARVFDVNVATGRARAYRHRAGGLVLVFPRAQE